MFEIRVNSELVATFKHQHDVLAFLGTLSVKDVHIQKNGHQYVVRRNLMSQLPYLEAKDTPLYCSPASETYWSM